MIVDTRADYDHARSFNLTDAETGENLNERVFYADDEAGFFLRYSEGFPPDHGDPRETASERVERKIKLAPKGQAR